MNPATLSDDLALDNETGLVWTRNANLLGQHNWLDANTLGREMELGNRSSLVDPSQAEGDFLPSRSGPNHALPAGHPFVNVQFGSGVRAYWSSTNYENPTAAAWFLDFWRGAGPRLVGLGNKSIPGFVWPVRGGA
jgi:hypothetical protein